MFSLNFLVAVLMVDFFKGLEYDEKYPFIVYFQAFIMGHGIASLFFYH